MASAQRTPDIWHLDADATAALVPLGSPFADRLSRDRVQAVVWRIRSRMQKPQCTSAIDMTDLRRSAAAFKRRLGHRATINPETYDPARYWDSRAEELIEIYDHPEDWASLKWMRSGVEEELVPSLLAQRGSRSAFVIGAGSGRQYQYLLPVVETLIGIDISPRLVAECRRRYPTVETEVCSIVGAGDRPRSVDAVVSSAVLQHVPADQIAATVSSVKALARDLVVLRELTLAAPAAYQWAHSHREMFDEWSLIREMVTDERPGVRVELLAFVRTTE